MAIFVGVATPRVGTMKLSASQQKELAYFAAKLLVDGPEFRKDTFLVQSTGTIRPQIISRFHNLIPEGWPYFRKMQQENPDLPAAVLLEQYLVNTTDTQSAFEKNLFLVRVVEELRKALEANASEIASENSHATTFLSGLHVPQIPKNPCRAYPDDTFVVMTSNLQLHGALAQYVETRPKAR